MSNQDGWNNDRSPYAAERAGSFSGRAGSDPRQDDPRRDEQNRAGPYGRAEGRPFDVRPERGFGPGAAGARISQDPYRDAYASGSGADAWDRSEEGRRAGYGQAAARLERDPSYSQPRGGSFERPAGYAFAGEGVYPARRFESGPYEGSSRDRFYDDPAFASSGAVGAASRWDGDGRLEDAERRAEHRGRGPKDYKRSDERIREDVNDVLTEDSHLDATGVTVEIKDAEVTLAGMVHSRHDKRRAEDLAERVSGVKHVQNNLRIHDSNYNAATASAGSSTASAGPHAAAAARTALS